MKRKKVIVPLVGMLAMSVFGLSGCGSKSTAPEDFTFSTEDGSFSFKTVENAETYTVGVSKILNDSTGEALLGINGAVSTTLEDGSEGYIWSEQTGSNTGLADSDGDGIVDGTVVFREYSSSATEVGAVKEAGALGVGHYIVQAVASSNSELENPEAATYEFTVGGTLETPAGFTAQVNEEGYMEITAPNSYYLSCLTATGLAEKMIFEISDGSSVIETIEMDDFSYTNTVNGPTKNFTFNNETVTGTTQLDSSAEYTVVVTAEGDGDEIESAAAEAYMASKLSAVDFASEYDLTSSAECGDYSITLTLGTDAAGNNIYELAASVNSTAILRENGTYTTDGKIQELSEKQVYGENTEIKFTASETEAEASVLDGKTLTVVKGESAGGWGQEAGDVYYLSGTGLALNEMGFEFTGAASSGPGPF